MKKENLFSKKEKELIYLGASIASGCRPCTKYHLKKSSETGLTDIEINKIFAFAISIRDNATRYMESLVPNYKPNKNMEENEQVSLNRNEILVGIAASYSVNFPLYLEKYLSAGRNSGIIDNELSEIISMSKYVIDKAKAHADMVADKIGIKQQIENKNDCCCSSEC